MAPVILASCSLQRQQRRCVSLRDFRLASSPACKAVVKPFYANPRSSLGVQRSPQLTGGGMQGGKGTMWCKHCGAHVRHEETNCWFKSPQETQNLAGQRSPGLTGQRSPRFTGVRAGTSGIHWQLPDASRVQDADSMNEAKRKLRRAKTLGAQPTSNVAVAVVAPGGGTGANSAVYSALARKGDFSVNILGKSQSEYDRYPPAWKIGSPAPNLESFALDLLVQGRLDEVECLVVGSRGGQVVLPTLWKIHGEEVPPAVVMNGGCAMPDLPISVHWPDSAVTFLLIGGKDHFRGRLSFAEYLADAQCRVPEGNETTAILLVHEMLHMPQAELLMAILQRMICAVTSWRSTGHVPADDFCSILGNLREGGWNGKLTYKTGKGTSWASEAFP